MNSLYLIFCFVLAIGQCDEVKQMEALEDKLNRLIETLDLRDEKQYDLLTRKVETQQSEINFLRTEYQRLSSDYLRLEDSISLGQHSLTLEENAHKTIDWLKTTVSEFRSEFVDLARTINSSISDRANEEVKSDVEVVKKDVMDIRQSVDSISAMQLQLRSEIDGIRGEMKERLKHEMELATLEKVTTSKMVQDSFSVNTQNRRHRRHSLYNEVDVLNHFVKSLVHNQEILERNIHKIFIGQKTDVSNLDKIEKELKNVLSRNAGVTELISRLNVIADKESRLENLFQEVNSKLANIDKVQSSTLQIFEAVEEMEDKYDDSLREIQSEISKLDAASQQLSIDVENLKDEDADEKASLLVVQGRLQKVQDNVILARNLATHEKKDGIKKEGEEAIVSQIGEIQKIYKKLLKSLPQSCQEVKKSAVSTILPSSFKEPITIACDAETDKGGWMIIQRRINGDENFNRDWDSYRKGFGKPSGEYWLGNDKIHELTKMNNTELRIDLWDIYGRYWWAHFDTFHIGDAESGYVLHSQGFRGNASDALSYHEGMKFSTLDKDHDISNTNCAQSYQGGWWYSHCQHVNINGKYALGLTWYNSSENEWIAVSRVEMKVRERLR
ncbi:protein scabrous-like [Artemia franciscana]|uniref:Fibrinogen C-terminal domain-containing protein n=1 Tax=Artemia franciscana TaxID=6661 RepID=A0AA88I186_ARTSF|nr:hypothetical protein QYM36_004798 [Artemia franciscana]